MCEEKGINGLESFDKIVHDNQVITIDELYLFVNACNTNAPTLKWSMIQVDPEEAVDYVSRRKEYIQSIPMLNIQVLEMLSSNCWLTTFTLKELVDYTGKKALTYNISKLHREDLDLKRLHEISLIIADGKRYLDSLVVDISNCKKVFNDTGISIYEESPEVVGGFEYYRALLACKDIPELSDYKVIVYVVDNLELSADIVSILPKKEYIKQTDS